MSHKERIINVTLGQRSCLFSHLSLIKYAKDNNLKNVLIFEDDAIFNDDINVIEVLSESLEQLKNIEWDMFKLGCLFRTPVEKIGNTLFKLGNFTAAHAYAVNHTCYDILLDFPFKEEMNIDSHYGDISAKGIINAYTPNKPIAFQKESYSNIQLHHVGGIENYMIDRYKNMIK